MKIDPNSQSNQNQQESKNSFERKMITAGNKIFAPVGVSYIKPRDKVILEITSVCIKDKEGKGEEGAMHRESFWLTPNASWKIANWSVSMGNTEPFDASDKDDVEKIISNGVAFHGVVSIKKNNGYENRQIDSFYRASELLEGEEIVITDKMDKIITEAEEAFPKIIDARRKKGVTFVSGGDNPSEHDEIPF